MIHETLHDPYVSTWYTWSFPGWSELQTSIESTIQLHHKYDRLGIHHSLLCGPRRQWGYPPSYRVRYNLRVLSCLIGPYVSETWVGPDSDSRRSHTWQYRDSFLKLGRHSQNRKHFIPITIGETFRWTHKYTPRIFPIHFSHRVSYVFLLINISSNNKPYI